MEILKKYILPLVLLPFLTGCFQEFEPDINTPSVLCLNSLIIPGEEITVSVTRTWKWSEGETENNRDPHYIDVTVKDADVKLYVNDAFVENLVPTVIEGNGYHEPDKYVYAATYRAQTGDKIRIEATSKDFGEAWGEVNVPLPPVIEDCQYVINNFRQENPPYISTVFPNNNYHYFELSMALSFTDPADKEDYYMYEGDGSRFSMDDESGNERILCSLSPGWLEEKFEPLFSEHLTVIESVISDTSGYTFFSDRQISGQRYPIHIKYPDAMFYLGTGFSADDIEDVVINLTLSSISESYYKHVISVWKKEDGIVGSLGNVGLGDPVFSASNVSTHAGVIAAKSSATYQLDLTDKIKDLIRNLK